MISMTTRAGTGLRAARLRNWSVIAGLTGVAAGATMVTGAFLPWVETFAGLIGIAGIRGGNGRILAAAGLLIAAAGLYHAVRGGSRSRWLTGLGGFAALGFSGYLLIQLAATMRTLGGDSMVLARGGPGLWVTAAGSLLAFATLFLPLAPADVPANPPVTGPGRRIRADAIRQRIMGCTADLESAGVRRGLQIALGLAWLTDAALQFQPAMFGQAFVSQMLVPALSGNPAALASPALGASRLIGRDVPAWNTTFALVQLAIAAGLLWRPAVKAALAGSIAWALAVWWLGEGLGGVLTGTGSPVTGAPGAVILYALIAVMAWPRRSTSPGRGGLAAASLLGRRCSRAAWLALWGSFAYLILQPSFPGPRAACTTRSPRTPQASRAGWPPWTAAPHPQPDHTAWSYPCCWPPSSPSSRPGYSSPPRPARPWSSPALAGGGRSGSPARTSAPWRPAGHRPRLRALPILLAAAYWPPRPKPPHRDLEAPVTVLAGQGTAVIRRRAGQAADRS